MSKKILILALVVMMAITAFSSVSAGNTPANESPFTSSLSECTADLAGETITFYHFGDLSGPYAFITQPILAAVEDAVALLNANGGVCGAEVVSEYRDTGGSQEQAQAFWDEFSANEDFKILYLYASADGELLLQQAADSEVVLMNAAASELALFGEAGEPSWQFSAIPLYVDQLGLFCDYVAENWADMGMEGDPVIGHLSWEGAFGRSSDTPATQAYCASKGIGYAGAQYFLPGTPDVSTQLTTLTDAGANIIYTTSLASGPALVAGTVAASGQDLMVGGVSWALDTTVIALGGEATNGMTGNMPILWWDEVENPAVQQVTAIWAENRLAADPEGALRLRGLGYIGLFPTIDIWAEAYIRAINEVGFENVDGVALKAAMESMASFEAFGGIIRVDYTEGKRSGAFSRIGSIQFTDAGPQILPATDWTPVPSLWANGADVPQE